MAARLDIAIEPVPVDAAPAIVALIERVVLESVDATDAEKQAFLANIRANLEQWMRDPASGLHLKADAAGRLVGVVMVKGFSNLCHLFVAPDHQGQGIGRALLQAAVNGCRGKAPTPGLQLNAAKNAVAFYERMGWRRIVEAVPAHSATRFELLL